MPNLKNITELPVVESAEGLNVIVNDNGTAKQIPADVVGGSADWNQNDENGAGYVKNRTHWAEKALVEETRTFMPGTMYPVDTFIEQLYQNRQTVTYFVNGEIELHFHEDGEPNDDFNMWAITDGNGYALLNIDLVNNGFIADAPVTVTLTVETEVVHKLDPKYLPETPSSGTEPLIVTLSTSTANGTTTYSVDKTIDEISTAYLSGRPVYLHDPNNGNRYLTMIEYYYGGAIFQSSGMSGVDTYFINTAGVSRRTYQYT